MPSSPVRAMDVCDLSDCRPSISFPCLPVVTCLSPVRPAGCPGRWRRVVRGGSWNNNQDNARASNRNNNHPNNRNNNIGFRVVCLPHIGLTLPRDRLISPTTVCGTRWVGERWRGCIPSARHDNECRRAHTETRCFLGLRAPKHLNFSDAASCASSHRAAARSRRPSGSHVHTGRGSASASDGPGADKGAGD
jgi:hypothetical protein